MEEYYWSRLILIQRLVDCSSCLHRVQEIIRDFLNVRNISLYCVFTVKYDFSYFVIYYSAQQTLNDAAPATTYYLPYSTLQYTSLYCIVCAIVVMAQCIPTIPCTITFHVMN